MEESEDPNPVKKQPSLPENYVTIAMLKERWLQRKKQEEQEEHLKKKQEEEEEEHLKLQPDPKPDPIEENPSYVTLSMLKERWLQAKKQAEEEQQLKPPDPIDENPNGSEPGTKPPIRDRNRRRGCVKEHEEGPGCIDSAGKSTKSGFRGRRKPRVSGNVKLQGNAEENGAKEGGGELQLAENGADKASGRSRSGRKKWKKRLKRNEGRMKALQQGEERLGKNGKKDGDGFVGLAEDTTHPDVKIDKSFQDLSLNDPKNANVKNRATRVKDQQPSTRCEEMAEEEKRFGRGRKDRMRVSSGGGWRQMGHRRAPSTRAGGDQLVWVKKGETPGGCVTTDSDSKVPSMKDRYMQPQS